MDTINCIQRAVDFIEDNILPNTPAIAGWHLQELQIYGAAKSLPSSFKMG